MELSALELALVGVIVFGAGAVQGFIGFGYSVLTVPLLRLIDPDLAPIPQVLLALALSAGGAWRERSHLNTKGVGSILVGRVPGALAGAWLLGVVAVTTLDLVTAGVVLGGVLLLAMDLHIRQTPVTRLVVGALSGFTGTASAMSGPPLALYYQENNRSEARASLGLIFAVGAIISVVALIWSGALRWSHVWIAALLLLPTAFGFAASSRWIYSVDEKRLRQGVLVVSALSGLILLVRAFA